MNPTRAVFLAALSLAACGGAEANAPPSVHEVSAIVALEQCNGLAKQEARHAKEAMDHLVDGCRTVPHGHAHFTVVLHPGGALQFADADPSAGGRGEIPICAVSQKLVHSVRLSAPCKMDVRLEESTVAVDAGAGK